MKNIAIALISIVAMILILSSILSRRTSAAYNELQMIMLARKAVSGVGEDLILEQINCLATNRMFRSEEYMLYPSGALMSLSKKLPGIPNLCLMTYGGHKVVEMRFGYHESYMRLGFIPKNQSGGCPEGVVKLSDYVYIRKHEIRDDFLAGWFSSPSQTKAENLKN